MNNVKHWQFVLSSNWIIECCKLSQRIKEDQYIVRPLNSTVLDDSASHLSRPGSSITPIPSAFQMTPISQPSPSTNRVSHIGLGSTGSAGISGKDDLGQSNDRRTAEPTRDITSHLITPSIKRESNDQASRIDSMNKKTKVDQPNIEKEMISYGTLKVWVKDAKEYLNIRGLPEPEKTYRKKEIFNILVIEIANWANNQDRIYRGDVRRFCSTILQEKRPWRDWSSTWQFRKHDIEKRLNKLNVDTSTWNLHDSNTGKVQARSDIIYISSDSEEDGKNQNQETDFDDGDNKVDKTLKDGNGGNKQHSNDINLSDSRTRSANNGNSNTNEEASEMDSALPSFSKQVKEEPF